MAVSDLAVASFLAGFDTVFRSGSVWRPLVIDRSSQMAQAKAKTLNIPVWDQEFELEDRMRYRNAQNPTRPNPRNVQLVIDTEREFRHEVDYMDEAQTLPSLMAEAGATYGQAYADEIDRALRGRVNATRATDPIRQLGNFNISNATGPNTDAIHTLVLQKFARANTDANNMRWRTAGRTAVVSNGMYELIGNAILNSGIFFNRGVQDGLLREFNVGRLYGWDLVQDRQMEYTFDSGDYDAAAERTALNAELPFQAIFMMRGEGLFFSAPVEEVRPSMSDAGWVMYLLGLYAYGHIISQGRFFMSFNGVYTA